MSYADATTIPRPEFSRLIEAGRFRSGPWTQWEKDPDRPGYDRAVGAHGTLDDGRAVKAEYR